MSNILEVQEGTRYQSDDENIVYTITTTNRVTSPSSPTAVVYDVGTDTDVSSTVMPSGSHSVSGDIITLKGLTALTAGHTYRVEVKYTAGSSTYENYFIVKCLKLE